MAANAEQIGRDRRYVNLNGKAIKKMTSRKRRRIEKQNPEDAPKRNRYDGWSG